MAEHEVATFLWLHKKNKGGVETYIIVAIE